MRNKPVKVLIEVPIHIITPMIKNNRTNSLFYAHKNIAVAQHANRVYVLTTAGDYKLSYKGNRYHSTVASVEDVAFQYDKDTNMNKPYALPIDNICQELTDTKIAAIEKDDIENWGWFGINIWVDNDLIAEPGECYSQYDEAMDHFREIVKKDIEGDKLSEDDTIKLLITLLLLQQ